MPNRLAKLQIMAHAYVTQCRSGDTTHAHALEDLISRGLVTRTELRTSEEELEKFILAEAKSRLTMYRANGSRDAVHILGSFLTCGGLCAKVITSEAVDISEAELRQIRHDDAVETAQWYLEQGGDSLDMVRELIDGHGLTAKELHMEPDLFEALSSPPSSRP